MELVRLMAAETGHRGSGHDGLFCDDGISLGHHDLRIIDPGEQARQPMVNENGTIRLICDGTIYNFQELRNTLLAKGHQFASSSDAEVIIHGYEEYGVDILQKLRGMFTFAVWDLPRKRLFLARDRIGIKPLHYFSDGSKLVFASEVKAILNDTTIPRRLNRRALYDYLGFGFVPAPDTMFESIHKLPAGWCLMWENGRLTTSQYWDLSFKKEINKLCFEAAAERELDILEEVVKSHLVGDLPPGIFLSGGLASSALVAFMREHTSGKFHTFALSCGNSSPGEPDYAKQIADEFQTEHHVFTIEPPAPETIEETLGHLDEPVADLSAIPLLLACRKAKEFATVCLSGHGANEVFAGYERFKASRIDRWLSIIPEFIRKGAILPLITEVSDRQKEAGVDNLLKRFMAGSSLPRDGEHLRWAYFLDKPMEALLFSPLFKQQIPFDPFRRVREYAGSCDTDDTINREIYLDTRFMLPDSVLMNVDKMSMAGPVEMRLPFLDHTVVEFNASLPGNWKLNGLAGKHILRSTMDGVLPKNILRRKKESCGLPACHLLRDQLKNYMIGVLNESPVIRDNMNSGYVSQLIQEHLDAKRDHSHVLWGLMNIAIWHRKFKVT